MIARLSPDLVRELQRAGDRPLPLEDPQSRRVYVLVDTEQYEVVRRSASDEAWSENKNDRRCALIRKRFSKGITPEEARELGHLQDELSAFRKMHAPLPYDIVDALQEAVIVPPGDSAASAS
jgi:hypothetical protein